MRIEFKWSAWLVIGVLAACTSLSLGWADGAWASAVLLACVLLHEAAHIAVARSFALRVKALVLSGKGAYTVRDRSNDRTTEVMIVLAGPIMNMLLVAAFAAVPARATAWIAGGNFILGVGNLIPVKPSDGWRIWKLLTDV